MPGSDPIERVAAVLEGRQPDRPPVSFWYHFESHECCGEEAVRAHLRHLRRYDLDFLKVMNDNGYPSPGPIQTVKDLAALKVLQGNEPEFARQLELLERLHDELGGRVLMSTTLFNAWATLRRLVTPRTKRHSPPSMDVGGDEASRRLSALLGEDRAAVAEALAVIGESLAQFARHCLEAGADGVFLSVRDDWVDTPANGAGTYDQLVRPTDLAILGAVSKARFNLLHICGRSLNFKAFAEYPVHVVNWADRAAGPAIRDVRDWLKPAICAGVDNLSTLVDGTPQQCAAEVQDALTQAGGRPIIIGPGCTYDPQRVPQANLEAIRQAVELGRNEIAP